jgi:phosphoserine aminotransferase
LDPDARYLHITTNNTIFGTCYSRLPDTGGVPLAADMSSNILSEEMDVSRFGVIYAGAQKNVGPAGVTIVIIQKALIGRAPASTPTMLDYKTHSTKTSLFNTPPCFAIYVAGLVFEHFLETGGVSALAQRNREKAALLYDYLDGSKFFRAKVGKPHRSIMNVTLGTPSPEHDAAFVTAAAQDGFLSLAGHRSAGGIRASIYNAMPVDGVRDLVEFMRRYEKENG